MRFSKKQLIIAGVLLVLVGSVAYLGLKKPSEKISKLSPAEQRIAAILEKDADEDGLKDWEEVLWKTDSHNKDSDRDGTSDGEEVSLGRDPNKPSPDDFLSTDTGTTSTSTHSTAPKTATESFSRDFFAKYITLKKNQEEVSEEDQNLIITELLSKEYAPIEKKTYDLSSIRASTDSSKTALRAYGNAIGKSFIDSTPQVVENELTVFENALNIKNEGGDGSAEIAKLDLIIAGYQKNIKDILALRTPRTAQDLHIALLNALSGVTVAIESLRIGYDDPVRGLTAVQVYQTEVLALSEAMTQLYAYFVRNGVTFTQDEGGYIFASVI